jgi:hypothetical protein
MEKSPQRKLVRISDQASKLASNLTPELDPEEYTNYKDDTMTKRI